MSNPGIKRILAALSVLLALWCARGFTQGPILNFMLLERDVIEKRLRLASRDNGERERVLERLFQEAGCKDEHLGEQRVKHERVPNLVCTLPGAADSQIIVAGHMDHVTKGRGVVDDWSGAALLPSLFQSLHDQPRKHTFLFIGFTDEEGGLVGSRSYVKQIEKGQISRIQAMVNLECLGLSPSEIWGQHANAGLMKMYGDIAHTMQLPNVSVNVPEGADDDADSFRDRKVPTITIHSVTQETWSVLHSPHDDFPVIHWDDYYNSYHLMAAYLAYIDEALPR